MDARLLANPAIQICDQVRSGVGFQSALLQESSHLCVPLVGVGRVCPGVFVCRCWALHSGSTTLDAGRKQWTRRSKSRGWLYECRVRKPTLASVFSFGWGQTLALLVACQHITGTLNNVLE